MVRAPGATGARGCRRAAWAGPRDVLQAGLFSGGTALLTGFTPGTTVWVRVRTAGIKGVMGAWSDPAKIMVI